MSNTTYPFLSRKKYKSTRTPLTLNEDGVYDIDNMVDVYKLVCANEDA